MAVRMWMARNPTASSETCRCELSPANRGSPGSRARRSTRIPSTTAALSSTMQITPVAALAVPIVGISGARKSRSASPDPDAKGARCPLT